MSDSALRPDDSLIGELSPVDRLKRAARMADASPNTANKMPACATDVWFSVFFDGTGNSLYEEEPRPADQQGYSNVARLFMAHSPSDVSKGMVREYVQGVGTKFPEIADPGGNIGAATGYMGMDRVNWAEKRLALAINTQKARGLKIGTLHVAVFGFSRGATLARAFVTRLANQAHQRGGTWIRDGTSFRIYFLGVFDTVASVGLPRDHGTYAKDLGVPSIVERCVHMVAGHELRFAFPVDSVRRDGRYPANVIEYVFPGAHSDIGGGYASNEQGRSNAYAKLPLHTMYREALMAGVPISPAEKWAPTVAKEFAVPAGLPAAFRTYMSALETTGDSLEEQIFGHLKLYWRWRKLRMSDTQAPIPQRLDVLSKQAKEKNRPLLERLRLIRRDETELMYATQGGLMTDGQIAELKADAAQASALNKQISTNDRFDADKVEGREADNTLQGEARALQRVVGSGRASNWERAVWEAWNDPRPLPEDVAAFFDTYIHDSQAAWNHATDAAAVALNEIGAAQTCGRAFNAIAAKYCAAVADENLAGTIKYLRPRTLFFGPKEAVFTASDTNF